MSKKADLQPPLGCPGGPCHVVQRIEDNVRSPAMKEDLIDDVESGGSLSNSEAHKVYDIEVEKGNGPFSKVEITAHAQYRMDLRSITVPEVRLALKNFALLFQRGKNLGTQPVRKPALRMLQQQYLKWRAAMGSSKIEFTDPRTQLTVIFVTPRKGVARLISTWWQGQSDPKSPKNCYRRQAVQEAMGGSHRAPVQEWGTQTFTRPPQSEPRTPPLQVPSDHNKGRDWYVPKFEYSTPDHNQNLDQGTVTPGGSSMPGDDYGHPYKERGEQRRTDRIAYTPNKRNWGKSRKQKGRAKTKSRRNYRKNRAKIKRTQKKYRRIQHKKPQFKRMQARRRKMTKNNPKRFRRRGSVLTAPEIVFFTGPNLEMLGVVRSVSPSTGLVTFILDGSRCESLSVPALLSAAVLATEADAAAFFQLVDIEIGLEAYDDLELRDVQRCSEIFQVDLTGEDFRSKCEDSIGKVNLADMTTDELEFVTNTFVSQILDEGGSEREERDTSEDLGDEVEIDPSDDSLYYGEVELPEDIAEAQGRLAAYMHVQVDGLANPGGYPSQFNPSNRPDRYKDDKKPGNPSINGPQIDQGTSIDDGGSSKVIPTVETDLINHTYENSWARSASYRIATRMAEIMEGVAPDVINRSTGISPTLKRVDQKKGVWTFQVSGGERGPYTVKLQGLRKGNVQNLEKMDIKVSCSCGFWRWQGPEYHAVQKGYLLGKPRGTASTPDIMDPDRVHPACKHVVAVFSMAKKYFLRPLSKLGHDLPLSQKQRMAYRYIGKLFGQGSAPESYS